MINKLPAILFVVLIFCLNVSGQPVNPETKIIAGIEVGSKGVKITILEKSLAGDNQFKLLKDSSVNTDFISFTANTYDATLAALSGLYF